MVCDFLFVVISLINVSCFAILLRNKNELEREKRYLNEDIEEYEKLIFKHGGLNDLVEYKRKKRHERRWIDV